MPPRGINEIVHDKRSITADTALRLAGFFGAAKRFWHDLQVRYDLEVEKSRHSGVLERPLGPHHLSIARLEDVNPVDPA